MGAATIKSNSILSSFPSQRVFLGAILLLVSSLCHFNLVDAKTTVAVAKKELKDNTALKKRELSPKTYCSISTPCTGYNEYCDLETNSCRESCGYNEYWNGYSCSYCYYGEWDYDDLVCNYGYYVNDDWIIWTVLGVCLGGGLLICIIVAICCVRNPNCPFYRRRLRKQQQAAAQANIVAQPTMVYGNPGMYPQQMVYAVPVQGQGQFIQYQQQQQQQQQSAPQGAPVELMPINNTASETTTNAPVASIPVARVPVASTPVTSAYPSLNP